MFSSVSEVLLRNLLVFAIALAASNFATLVLAQEFQAGRSPNHKSMAEADLTPHVRVGVAKNQLEPPAPGESVPAPRSGEAVAVRRPKDRHLGADQSSDLPTIDDVPLTSARRISIKAYNYPEQTGHYSVNADQTVSIPALGRIQVHNMTAADLERVVIEKMQSVTGGRAHVTIEVIEYRPITVSGYVETPGSFAWTPGMTVLEAASMAGGLYRPRPNGARSLKRFEANVFGIERIAEIKRITDELKRTLASLARARAERDNLAQIDVPQRLVELVGMTEAQALIDRQTKLLQFRRETVSSQKSRLEQASEVASMQIAALTEQQELLKKQIKNREEYLALLKGASKGSVRRVIILNAEARVADLEEKTTNNIAASARVRSSIIGLKLDAERLIQDRQLAVAEEIDQLERNAARMEIELAAARESYATFKWHKYIYEYDENRPVVGYEIMRREDREVRTILANRATLLRPGDILTVKVKATAAPEMQSQ